MTPEDLDRLEALHGAANLSELTSYHIVSKGFEHLANLCTAPDKPCFVLQHRKEVMDYIAAAHNALPALIAEARRLKAEILRIDKEADVERDVQVACDTTVYETVKRVTGRRCYHTVMEAVEDLARECERLREYDWKSFAEAPKDGTEIEAWSKHIGRVWVWFDSEPEYDDDPDDAKYCWHSVKQRYTADEFTHFRVLRGPEGV